MSAIAGQQLVAALVAFGLPSREELPGEQALGQVVDPPIPLAPGQAEDARLGESLEDRPDLVRRPPVPVDRGAWREVGRAERAVLPDALEELLDQRGVLVECSAVVPLAGWRPR